MNGSGFLTPLRTQKIGEWRWLLTDDLEFYSDRYKGVFIAPRGFQTDLASIPRFAWTIFPKVGKHDAGAVIHDAAYGHALVTRHMDRIHAVKDVADRLFLEGMIAEGVNQVSARTMYRIVSWFGKPETHPLRAW